MEIVNKFSHPNNKYLDSGFNFYKNIVIIIGIIGGIASFTNFILNRNKKDPIELSINKESNKLKEANFELEKYQLKTKTSVLAILSYFKKINNEKTNC
jgi:hypothetical protein